MSRSKPLAPARVKARFDELSREEQTSGWWLHHSRKKPTGCVVTFGVSPLRRGYAKDAPVMFVRNGDWFFQKSHMVFTGPFDTPFRAAAWRKAQEEAS